MSSKLRHLAPTGAANRPHPVWTALWWALAATALALHTAAYVYALVNQSYWQDDTTQYLTQALNLCEYHTVSQSYLPPIVPDVQRTPGYGVFLWLLGLQPWLVLLVQHILVIWTGWFIYLILKRLHSREAARWGGVVWVALPFAANFASFMLNESLFSAMTLAGLWLFTRAVHQETGNQKQETATQSAPSWISSAKSFGLILACVLWALACYVKGLAFMVLPLAGVVWLWVHRRRPKAWLPLVAGALLATAIVAPWWLRNRELTGRWTFGTLGQTALIYGRLGGVLALEKGLPMDDATLFILADSLLAQEVGIRNIRTYPPEQATQETALFTPQAEAAANAYMRTHWTATLRFQLYSFGLMLRGVGRQTAWVISYNKPYTWFCTALETLLLVIIYLGLAGAIWRIRRLTAPEVVALLAAMAFVLLHAAAWADGRYRLVADPLLVLLAAPVWVRWAQGLTVRLGRRPGGQR